MRDPKRIPKIMRELEKLWNEVPDWRLGQLICNIARSERIEDPFFLEDDKLLEFLTASNEKKEG